MCDPGISEKSIVNLIADLANESTRAESARAIASMAGAGAFLVFIKDHEIDSFLPGPGFPQSLPNGKAWQLFIRVCLSGQLSGTVPYPSYDDISEAHAIVYNDEGIAVFVGSPPPGDIREEIQKALPLLTALMRREQEALNYKGLAITAEKAAEKAEKLMRSLDAVKEELRRALIEQEKDKEAINYLAQKKDEFMNIASHELKTPITSMKAYIQMISNVLNEEGNKQLLSYADKAGRQVDKLVELVNDLLDVSKVQAGYMQFRFSRFNFGEIISECVEQMQNSTHKHKIIIEGNSHVEIAGDKMRLEQVVSNLLSNAIKYSPEADRVIIRTGMTNGLLKVEVQDLGIGIPGKHLDHIFDRFYRVTEVSNKFFGLGLGLYISSEIIKRHKGQIGVESKEGKGSTFWFTIPVLEALV